MSDVYPYPGDDPSALSGLSYSVELANGFVTRMSTGLGETRSELQSAWTGNASQLAQADMAKLTAAFPTMGTKLTSAKTAVDTYRTAVVSIRGQVDELRAQHAKLAAALQSEQESYGRAGRFVEANADPGTSSADIAKQTAEVRAGIAQQETKTKNQLAALDQQYQALVTRSNTAASTCSVALQSASTQYSYQGSTPTTQGIADALGLGNLGVAHLEEAKAAAKQAATLATQINGMNASDPDMAKKVAELNQLTSKYYGDPAFAVPFYQQLGQEGALKLPLQLGLSSGGENPNDVAQLQRTLGADLAAATQYYGNEAGNEDGVPQLSDDWVKTLLADGSKKFQINGQYSPQIYGYQGLGVLLHTGQYDAQFLHDSGNSIKDFESDYEKRSNGTSPWIEWGGPGPDSPGMGRLWWGGDGGATDDNGVDPMVGWSQAGSHNPAALRHALVGDNGLTNYLLNDRDWSVTSDVPTRGQMPRALTLDGPHHGLMLFGTALDKAVGSGATDPESRDLFRNIVRDLGDSSTNHRITDGAFKDNDWIPPELRPSIGDMVVKNIGDVHTSESHGAGAWFDDGNGGKDLQDLSRVLADVGKDPTARVNISHAENAYVTAVLPGELAKGQGHYSPENDLGGLGTVNALLQLGGNAHTDATTLAADAAHNARVDEISEYATFGADQAAGAVPVAGPYLSFGVDKISSLITDSLHVDHSQDAYVADANDNSANRSATIDVVNNAALASVDPKDLAAASPDLFPGGTIPSDYNAMSDDQQRALQKYLDDHGNPDWNQLGTTVTQAWESSYTDAAAEAIEHG